jgi:2-keto-4-pentenoate hydratase/2-oxohepta-3-ene-1,7-dioic acid hydratase in catechol pathway
VKIICIGRNYVAHVHELGNEVPGEPVFFLKPDTALLKRNRPFRIPAWSNDVQFEAELVVRICRNGKNIPIEEAGCYFSEIGLGIDFTARDIQNQLKSRGLPWEKAKAFDHSAALGNGFVTVTSLHDIKSVDFRLDINGTTVQKGNANLMIFGFDEIIQTVSKYITVRKGDLIYTGTPAGVGPVKTGDRLEGYIEGNKVLDVPVK